MNFPYDPISLRKDDVDSGIVRYAASESDYEMMFYASATNTSGVYALYWNAVASTDDIVNGSFPVVVKTTAPTVLS